jgi:hypothetical protein
MATLEEIRAKLLQQQNKAEGSGRTGGDSAMFPFWNTPEGGSTLIRFLPDGDPSNTFFWAERLVIKLPFQGIKGDHNNEVIVQVPCMEMYGETCPILAETRPWWKGDQQMQDLARRYWKKKSYLFQGFVVNSDFEEKDTPANPIRRFMINPSIFDIIKSSLMNPEMEDLPTDYIAGRDFKLAVTTKGAHKNYSTSNWSFKTRSLSPEQDAAIKEHGLSNLKDFLPKKPTAEELAIIKEMFAASVNDEAYDPARFEKFYRPSGFRSNNSYNAAPAAPAATETVTETHVAPTPTPTVTAPTATPVESAPAARVGGGAPDASEILRRIKERESNRGQ